MDWPEQVLHARVEVGGVDTVQIVQVKAILVRLLGVLGRGA